MERDEKAAVKFSGAGASSRGPLQDHTFRTASGLSQKPGMPPHSILPFSGVTMDH